MAEARAYAAYMHTQLPESDALAALPPYRALPMQALDHAAGYFLAFGIAAALGRTITVSIRPMSEKRAYDLTNSVYTGGRQLGGARLPR